MTPASLRCPFHPDREGVGICVACRRVVCADCATKLDGINHCKQCLEKKIGKASAKPGLFRRLGERAVALAVLAAAFVVLTGGYYAIGLKAADVKWFGAGLAETARALEDASDGLRRFRSDVGRYPSEGEGLAALADDSPEGTPIPGWSGPYVRPPAGGEAGRELEDGYGNRLIYVLPPGSFPRPGVLSTGANHACETDLGSLAPPAPAEGDDRIRWVR